MKEKKTVWLQSSSLSRSSIFDGIGLTGALTAGLVGFVTFCVIGFVGAVGAGLGAFFSGWDSGGLTRAAVVFIGGFEGRFSMLKIQLFDSLEIRNVFSLTERFSLEHWLTNVRWRFYPFEDRWSLDILSVDKILCFPRISLMNPFEIKTKHSIETEKQANLTSAFGKVIETSCIEPTVNSPWSDLTTDAGLKSSFNTKKNRTLFQKETRFEQLHLIVW